ncbi:hypothetical protein RJ639_045046 [Escallonia herrerae]|uniref:Gnk2-homologous domain-containing protein n=1 Tax=Escallonia herrerae TaxID=1293975 RepID=A0AA88WEV2_9ASTE|nr:hypothetical protein RJ639_045046 [Escallonia herrerae]
MDYPRLCICFLFILNFLVCLTTPQSEFRFNRCSTSGNYTSNSTYATNLKGLLSSIPTSSDLNSDGFFNASIGRNPDQVYAIGLCRGDLAVPSCRSCLNDTVQAITQACPNQKEASRGYDNCMLRFSNRNILGSMDDGFLYLGWNEINATNPTQFDAVLRDLLLDLRDRAAAGGVRKFAADVVNYTSLSKIYATEQCTPDISEMDCGRCLDMARNFMTGYATSGTVGATSIRNSCVLRFEPYQFYQPTADATPPPPEPQSPPDTPGTLRARGNNNRSRTIIAILIPTASAVLIVVLICLFIKLRKRKQRNVKSPRSTHFKAWKYWREGAGSNLIDPVLRADSGSIRDIIRCIHVGLLCVQENVASRPTMASIVLMLNSFSITLPLPSEPAFFMHSSIDPEFPLSEYNLVAKDSNLSTSKSKYAMR